MLLRARAAPKSIEPARHQVWPVPSHPGFRRSVDGAGAVAAPLLAGFSLTLLVLILPTLADTRHVTRGPAGTSVTVDHDAFSAAPVPAAVLLLLAGLLFIFSIQASLSMRYHSHTPGEMAELFPQHTPPADPKDPNKPPLVNLPGWDWTGTAEWASPMRIGDRWYSGWVRWYLTTELNTANAWAKGARYLYHAGISALLSGLLMLTLPPGGQGSLGRWLLVAVAAAGLACELAWIALVSKARPRLRRWILKRRKRVAPEGRTGG